MLAFLMANTWQLWLNLTKQISIWFSVDLSLSCQQNGKFVAASR